MKQLGILLLFLLHSSVYAMAQHALPAGVEPAGLVIRGFGINHEKLPSFDLSTRTGKVILKQLKAGVKHWRLHGRWQSYFGSGKMLDEGYLNNGVPHGTWKIWDSSGQIRAIRTYDSEKLERIQNELRTNHPRQVLTPLARLYTINPGAALGYISVTGSFASATSQIKPGLENLLIHNSDNIDKYRPPFDHCLHHGLYMNFSTKGVVLDSGYYKDGLPNGLWEHRTPITGSLWKGAYKNGLRQQEWKRYSADGKLDLLIFYGKNGIELWRKALDK